MTMRRRIFLFNTVMVLLSLLILFGMGGVCVLLFKGEFMKLLEQNAELSDDVYAVQTILLQQQKNTDSWETLSKTLSQYQFELYISDEAQNEVYSNAKHSEMECIEELEEGEFTDSGVRLYSMEGITIARCRISVEGNSYAVYAAYSPGERVLWGIDRGIFEMFVLVFVIAGIVMIAVLLLCSQIFTKIMIRRIMKPVDELNQAAIRIKEGNLDEPVSYCVRDEFGEVCETFNKMQKHLKEDIEKANAYERARTEMISGISHDLRTPLTSVKGFIKGMLDGIAATPQMQTKYLEISYQKACDMERLLKKLFFFSKLETGNMPFFEQEVELGSWVRQYVQERRLEEKEENYEILPIDARGAYWVKIDVEQMKRVLDNLLENSLKYAGTTPVRITITLQRRDGEIELCFADNGNGISEDKLEHVFEQFYRGDESRCSKSEGSGLGLYVCRYIVEQQGGRISAYLKNGFVIAITLPRLEERGNESNGKNIDCGR